MHIIIRGLIHNSTRRHGELHISTIDDECWYEAIHPDTSTCTDMEQAMYRYVIIYHPKFWESKDFNMNKSRQHDMIFLRTLLSIHDQISVDPLNFKKFCFIYFASCNIQGNYCLPREWLKNRTCIFRFLDNCRSRDTSYQNKHARKQRRKELRSTKTAQLDRLKKVEGTNYKSGAFMGGDVGRTVAREAPRCRLCGKPRKSHPKNACVLWQWEPSYVLVMN